MKTIANKFLLTLFVLIFGLNVFAAGQDDALNFFNSFVAASNNCKPVLLTMYSDDAKITRQVVKPDGKLVNVQFPIETYKGQIRLCAKMAKLKKYKNAYSNIKVSKVANGYKIEALRQPSLSDYKLKSAIVVQKQPNGEWLIVEELMQTKEQIFLKYAK